MNVQEANREAEAKDGTLTDRAYLSLRRDILQGAFKPGQPMRLESLKDRYGVGFSPLREALNRLHSEQLVDVAALRGFRIARMSLPQMWDNIETRILIETEALKRSIKKGGDIWEANLVSSFHSFQKGAQRLLSSTRSFTQSEFDEFESRHHDFHNALIAAAESPTLARLSEQMYHLTERYRRPALAKTSYQGQTLQRDHAQIMEAALARKPNLACDLLAAHYRKTGKLIEGMFNENSKPFD